MLVISQHYTIFAIEEQQHMDYRDGLKQLWQEAFGDSDAFVGHFMDKYYTHERMLAIEEDGNLLSMLHILPFTMDGKSIGYIYGVATALQKRGKGHATMLMKRAIEVARRKGYHALTTIPADAKLRRYYEKFGFSGAYKTRFEMPDSFDPGTGDEKSDLLSILPLKDLALPAPCTTLTLVWNGQ